MQGVKKRVGLCRIIPAGLGRAELQCGKGHLASLSLKHGTNWTSLATIGHKTCWKTGLLVWAHSH